MLGQDGGSFIY